MTCVVHNSHFCCRKRNITFALLVMIQERSIENLEMIVPYILIVLQSWYMYIYMH